MMIHNTKSKISYKSVVVQDDSKAVKEFHLKRLYELSLKSLGEIPQLDDPTEEQKNWFERRMHVLREVGRFGIRHGRV